jgi:hypothetical protein
MSRVRDILTEAIRKEVGECADPSQVVGMLYDLGVLDDCLARHGAVRVEFARRYSNTPHSAKEVMHDIGDEYGLTRQRVHQLLLGDY